MRPWFDVFYLNFYLNFLDWAAGELTQVETHHKLKSFCNRDVQVIGITSIETECFKLGFSIKIQRKRDLHATGFAAHLFGSYKQNRARFCGGYFY